jgi:selT/selW/selH-like putative selenoprotein
LLHDYFAQLPGGVTVVPGESGSFEVFLNRRKIFSKLNSGRFPEPNEVEDQIGERLTA